MLHLPSLIKKPAAPLNTCVQPRRGDSLVINAPKKNLSPIGGAQKIKTVAPTLKSFLFIFSIKVSPPNKTEKAYRALFGILSYFQSHKGLKNYCFIIFLLAFTFHTSAQTDPEFSKGFILYAKLHNGMITDLSAKPDLYVGGLQLAPQYTVVPHVLRAGLIAGGFYGNKKIQGEFGPSLSFKLKTFNANLQGARVGSLGNLNLLVDHLWGTGKQQLLGGGLILDVGNIINFGLTAHRDYNLNNWWFQSEIAIRISKKKVTPPI